MAGPVSTYLTTQTAAQTAFTVPFGLLALVNSSIATATAAGEFNVTVDCSLFVTEDVSNLRIYLDSLGYTVNFAKDTSNKSLNIDWGHFLTVSGSGGAVVVTQGTTPWVVAEASISPLATGAITSVPPSTLSTIVTHTAVGTTRVTKISCGGTVYAKFQLFLNATLIDTFRSGPDRAVQYAFDAPLALAPGDILDVKVTHFYVGQLEDFEATIYGA